MNCPNCGAPLTEGAAFCPNCGQPVAQVQQPDPGVQYQAQQPDPSMQYQAQQPDPSMQYQAQQPGPNPQFQAQQPGPNPQFQTQQQNVGYSGNKGSFVDMIKAKPIKLTTYIGYFFIFITSFLPGWITSNIGGGEGLLVTGGGILKLYALLFVLISVCGILVEFGSIIPALNGIAGKFKALPFSQFYLPGLAFIVWLLSILNGEFRDKMGSFFGLSVGYGICMYLCIIGILLVLVRPIMAIVKKEEYWD